MHALFVRKFAFAKAEPYFYWARTWNPEKQNLGLTLHFFHDNRYASRQFAKANGKAVIAKACRCCADGASLRPCEPAPCRLAALHVRRLAWQAASYRHGLHSTEPYYDVAGQ